MSRAPRSPAGWLWALGAGLLVAAARWREIALHGGEIPFLDQWLVEARQILLPWFDGTLTPASFLAPHHEHVPLWPRLLAWLEAVALGTWNGQVQATLNAGLMGLFVATLAAWFRRTLPLAPAFALTLLAVTLGCLPHSWENTVWGFQSTMPLALLFVFAHVHGSLAHGAGTRGWWLAQAAGLAALFTLGSMWAAPVAVGLGLAWTADFDRKRLVAATGLAAAGLALLLIARAQQPLTGAHAMAAGNLPQFLAAFLTQLGWPAAWPGAAGLIYLPVLFLALRLRGSPQAGAVDRIVLALALWAAAQAAAFAFARGSYAGFVSRYGDLLALGVLANGGALWRLLEINGGGPRLLVAALALGWAGAVGSGLHAINGQGHTLYFHEHSAGWAQVRRDAVRQYLTAKDAGGLAREEVRAVLFPDPAVVAHVLDDPHLAALLPAGVRPDPTPTRGDVVASILRRLRESWLLFAAAGGGLLGVGFVLTWRGDLRPETEPALPPARGATALALAGIALGSGALLFLWPQPFSFRPERRWEKFLTPAGTLTDLTFRITTETTYPKDRLTGGAALWPEDFRNTFFGTNIDGPGFTGCAESNPFQLRSPWYVVPFAGYPASAGNALVFRVTDAADRTVEEITCSGSNPGTGMTDIGFWAVDVRRHAGLSGRIVLQDGRTDAAGWVAVAPPHPAADGPKLAAVHQRDWAAEGTLAGLQSLQVLSAGFLVLSAAGAIFWWAAGRRPTA